MRAHSSLAGRVKGRPEGGLGTPGVRISGTTDVMIGSWAVVQTRYQVVLANARSTVIVRRAQRTVLRVGELDDRIRG